jgi:cell wall-associated NlpC family hydrolase
MSVSAALHRRARVRIATSLLAGLVGATALVVAPMAAAGAASGSSGDPLAAVATAWQQARGGVALARVGLADASDRLALAEATDATLLAQQHAVQAVRHMDPAGDTEGPDGLGAAVALVEAARDDAAALVQTRTTALYTALTDASVVEGLVAHEVADRGQVDEVRLRAEWDAAPERALDVMAFALAQAGKPYRFAADGPDAYDCSGLTMAAWGSVGVHLSHFAATQYHETQRVDATDLAPADLVFFGSDLGHVGLALGQHLMVHAPHTGDVVRVASIDRGGDVRTGRVPE